MKNKKKNGWLILLGVLFLPLTLMILLGMWVYRVTKRQLAENPDGVWYKQTWGIILLLVVFFPVGVYVLWRYSKFGKKGKIVSTVVFGIFTLICMISNSATEPNSNNRSGGSASIMVDETTHSTEFTTNVTTELPTEASTEPPTEAPTEPSTEASTEPLTEAPTEPSTEASTEPLTEAPTETPTEVLTEAPTEALVWIPESGTKYHRHSGCSNMENPTQVTKSNAVSWGYEPCKRCY